MVVIEWSRFRHAGRGGFPVTDLRGCSAPICVVGHFWIIHFHHISCCSMLFYSFQSFFWIQVIFMYALTSENFEIIRILIFSTNRVTCKHLILIYLFRCNCENCALMPTASECICCCEYEKVNQLKTDEVNTWTNLLTNNSLFALW